MPTPNYEHDPADCICGRRAIGIGIDRRGSSPQWLCHECSLLIEDIKRIRRFDPYEIKAREGGMEAAGPLVEEFGSDLAEWTEEQVLLFCGVVWKGCADRLRHLVRAGDAPF
jgi:hypothetical protein